MDDQIRTYFATLLVQRSITENRRKVLMRCCFPGDKRPARRCVAHARFTVGRFNGMDRWDTHRADDGAVAPAATNWPGQAASPVRAVCHSTGPTDRPTDLPPGTRFGRVALCGRKHHHSVAATRRRRRRLMFDELGACDFDASQTRP